MQTVSSAFTAASGGNSNISYLSYGVLISFTKAINSSVSFFTIGTSLIGGPDMIMGASGIPAFQDIYQYSDYSDYAISWSVTRSIGQFPYGVIGAEGDLQLDNTSLMFLPNYDATIGAYITVGRPVKLSAGFNGETINLFTGVSTQPINDIPNRTFSLQSFDGMDYLNMTTSYALGPIAAANNGLYVNVYANNIIGDLLTEAGFASNQYVAEQSLQKPIGFYSPYNLLMGEIIAAICEAEQAIFFFDENGIARFWNREHVANNFTPVWTFDETTMIDVQPEETQIINDVQIQANPRVVQPLQQVWQMGSATEIPPAPTTISYTNLITNPSFETNTTGWSGTSSTLTRITTQYYIGTAALQVTGNSGFVPIAKISYTYIASQVYKAQAYVKGTSGQTVKFFTTAGSLSSATITLDGGWDLLTWTFTPTTTSGDLEIQGNTNTSTIYVDAVMLQTVNFSPVYFDGNSTYNNTYFYKWSSTVNNSTSLAIPAGSTVVSADFQDTIGALPVSSVASLIYSTSVGSNLTSNYTANSNNDGSGIDEGASVFITGTSLTNIASSASTLSGSNYTFTFINTALNSVYITQCTLFGTPASVTYTIDVEYSNAASIALYGECPANNGAPLLIQNDIIQDPDTAHSNAYELVNDYCTPYQRLNVEIFPVPQLQLMDIVTVDIEDASQTLNYAVVGNTISSDASTLLKQSLELEVRVLTSYFTIGTSLIGGTDQIAP
jgi:hypothetical protein